MFFDDVLAIGAWLEADRDTPYAERLQLDRMLGRRGGKRILGRPLGGSTASVGPIRDAAFPWVILGRAWAHHQMVSERNHAKRDAIQLDLAAADALMGRTPDALRRSLARVIGRIRSRWGSPKHRVELAELIATLFDTDVAEDTGRPVDDHPSAP